MKRDKNRMFSRFFMGAIVGMIILSMNILITTWWLWFPMGVIIYVIGARIANTVSPD